MRCEQRSVGLAPDALAWKMVARSSVQAMSDDRPIFILSCSRSGSTLLRVAMNAHPDIASPPELHLLTLAQRLLWTWRITLDAAPEPEGDAKGHDDAWAPALAATRRSLDTIMDDYGRRTDAPIWCEKSVTAINHVDLLDALYPEARVIVLFRHAADVVASGLAAIADRPDGFDFEPYLAADPVRSQALLTYWTQKTAALLDAARRPGRIALRYEDFVRDPDRQLARITSALALHPCDDWGERIYKVPAQQGPGDTSVYARGRVDEGSLGRGASLDLSMVSRRIIKQANRLLAELGYDAVERPGTLKEMEF